MRNYLATVILVVFSLLFWHSHAEQEVDKTGLVSSKLKLLETLITNPGLLSRVNESENQKAKEVLESASNAYKNALEKQMGGDYEAAEQHADVGIRAVTQVSSLVTDSSSELLENKVLYRELRERVMAFREALLQVMDEKQSSSDTVDLVAIDKLLSRSDDLADNSDYAASNQELRKVAELLESALIRIRDKETLVSEFKFDSIESEYAYEKERNETYQILIKTLIDKKQTPADTLELFKEMLKRNEVFKREAEASAQAGDVQAALNQLEQGTNELARVLGMGG